MNLKNKFLKTAKQNIDLIRKLNSKKYLIQIENIINLLFKTLKENNKIMICGNGGSAADAQHLAAEFIVRLNKEKNRKALPMISLALDTSTITACGNDYSFKDIFTRPLEAIGQKGDVLFVISTSGMSKNILNVLKKAKKMKITSVALLGTGGGEAKKLSNLSLVVPSKNTARIQEAHIFIGHFVLNCVEERILHCNNV